MPGLASLRLTATATLALLLAAAGCGSGHKHHQRLIYIDIDDHGLSALWQADAPTLQGWARDGVLGYSRVDVPTHSNQSNMTLLTGTWPDADNVPGNAWLERTDYKPPFKLGPLITGDYIFYDKNPLGNRIASIYSAADDAGEESTYVGLLPPFEYGATDVHFTIANATLAGLTLTPSFAEGLLGSSLHYPQEVIDAIELDGPPATGESLNHFTIEQAAEIFRQAASGGPPPPKVMFIWDFIALDGDPTSEFGADGPELQAVVEDYDDALGDLVEAVDAAGYGDETNYVLTLDHGKVNTHNQVVLRQQLDAAVEAMGDGIAPEDYTLLNEDGDAQIYAKVPDAGSDPSATAEQQRVVHALVDVLQSGAITGLDTTRTMTWDGYAGTRSFRAYHADGPNQADILVFPETDWTLNDVDGSHNVGPIDTDVMPDPYGRHGGFSIDELYVPVFFYGPAFKQGALLPAPIDHADVAPTAMVALGYDGLPTAQGLPVRAALAGDPGETVELPSDPATSRDLVLQNAGFAGTPALASTPAAGVVLIDVSGLYAESLRPPEGEKSKDQVPADLRAFLDAGASFESYATWYRDWPVTEYQLLTGTYPTGPTYVPFAEDDPTMATIPAMGLFQMPPAEGFIADQDGYETWHSGDDSFGDQSLFDVAGDLGLTTAVIGAPDFQLQHIDTGALDVSPSSGKTIDQVLPDDGKALIYMAVDGGDKPKEAVQAAADAVAEVTAALSARGLEDQVLVVVTSRGGAPIDAADPDRFGPGSARHVPLVLAGPGVRQGVLLAGSARPVDVAPTILFALGAATTVDFADGTVVDGGTDPDTGVALPLPTSDRGGHALVQAFELSR